VSSLLRGVLRALVPKPARARLRKAWTTASRAKRKGVRRRFEIALPEASGGWGAGPTAPRRRLRIEAPSRLLVPRRLEEGGLAGYEPEGIGCLLALLERLGDGVFFDVGANIAPYSLVACALTRWRIVSFEPTPEVARVARRIRKINGLRFAIEELALDESHGLRRLYLSKTDSSNSLSSTFRQWERSLDVGVETLDRFVQRTDTWPSVLKIDTETTEPAVLRGGMHLLETRRPWIICEVLKGRTEAELEDVIGPLGYARYHIGERGSLEMRDRFEGDSILRDWLLAPTLVDEGLADRVRFWAEALLSCGPVQPLRPRAPSR
jgi:FkbM family methyltransferase